MRNWLITAACCALLLLAAGPSIATAADQKEGEAKHKQIGVEEGLFKGAIETTLWTIVVFFVLFGVLWKYAWGPIVAGLDKREQTIAHDKEEADRARREAEKMREELAAEKARANAEVRTMMEKARTDAQQTAADELNLAGKAELTAERERLRREIDLERDVARKDVFDQGARLAALLSAKTIKKQLTYEDHHALLDEALHEFRAAAAARKHDLENATA